MMRLLGLAMSGMVWLCVGTVLALTGGTAYLATSGSLTGEKWVQVLAIVQGVDMRALYEKHRPVETEPGAEQVALEQVARERALKGLDLTLREQAIEKGLLELRTLETTLKEDRRRYDQLKSSFDLALAKLEQDATAAGIVETQRTLEVIAPKQAKDQLLRMLSDGAMTEVVTVLKGMALDKRKKIFAEFKEAGEQEKLYEVLKHIRLGEPEKKLISDTRRDVSQFSGGPL